MKCTIEYKAEESPADHQNERYCRKERKRKKRKNTSSIKEMRRAAGITFSSLWKTVPHELSDHSRVPPLTNSGTTQRLKKNVVKNPSIIGEAFCPLTWR